MRPNYWTLVGIVAGLSMGILGTNLIHHERATVTPTPPDCAERMNDAARKCNSNGMVDYTWVTPGDFENKRIVCIRSRREELKP